jgi:HAD superfamily hydrolase (TIGR01484 family)
MYFLALATDYDGTLASHGLVSPEAMTALEQFKETGRRLILVTGRELEHVEEAFPRLDIFDASSPRMGLSSTIRWPKTKSPSASLRRRPL